MSHIVELSPGDLSHDYLDRAPWAIELSTAFRTMVVRFTNLLKKLRDFIVTPLHMGYRKREEQELKGFLGITQPAGSSPANYELSV